ncbi:MAG: hypothetical protein AAFQ09_04875 [Pseudomonadota bacterium]
MRLLVFVTLMSGAACFMGIYSYLADANGWTIVWRVIATLMVLQVVYFFLLVTVSFLSPPDQKSAGQSRSARTNALTKTQKH